MSKQPKRVFILGDFRDDKPHAIHIQQKMWVKGFLRLGCDVHRFSYRNLLHQLSPFRSKKLSRWIAKERCDQLLMEQIKNYDPHIVFLYTMKYYDDETVRLARQAAPQAVFIGRDDDPYPERNQARLAIAKQTDIVLTTFSGPWLQTYKNLGISLCAFIPNLCDPDIQYRYEASETYHCDLMFTGKLDHGPTKRNPLRFSLLEQLRQLANVKLYGTSSTTYVGGIPYFQAISGAKCALSINTYDGMRLYHSDRLINYLGCGAFVLSRRVLDTDLLYCDKEHLRYFDSVDEFFDLWEYYLKHDQERDTIGKAAQAWTHEQYSPERMVQMTIDLIDTGTYQAPWAEIL